MSTELAVDAFWEALERSGILSGEKLQKLEPELLAGSSGLPSSRSLAEDLVARGLLTRWQADKLLEGKTRGFMLGPYRLLEPLGRGGMGLVYLAEHTMMRRRCAIKVLPKQLASDPGVVERFYREAQAVAALDHPNIVRAYDVAKSAQDRPEDAIHYLVMEFVDGRDMQRKVEEDGVLGFREAAELIRQSAEGLAHAHAMGIIHRDVKPANLLVDRNGTVRLLDLGLATFFNDPEEAAAAAEQGRTVVGTADYLAPEQAVDSNKIDARADIYSLGMTFYFLLTGHAPYPTGSIVERLMAHQTRSPEPVERVRPDAPPGLLAKLYKMISRKPEQRYQSAREVADALAGWLKDNPADSGVLRRLGRLESVMRMAAQRAASGPSAKSDAAEPDLDFAPVPDEPSPSSSESGIRGKQAEGAGHGETSKSVSPKESADGHSHSRDRLREGASASSSNAAHVVIPPPAPLPAGAPTADDILLGDSAPVEAESPALASPLGEPVKPLAPAVPAQKEEETNLLQSPWAWLAAIVPVVILVGVLVHFFRSSSTPPPAVDPDPTLAAPVAPAPAPPAPVPVPVPVPAAAPATAPVAAQSTPAVSGQQSVPSTASTDQPQTATSSGSPAEEPGTSLEGPPPGQVASPASPASGASQTGSSPVAAEPPKREPEPSQQREQVSASGQASPTEPQPTEPAEAAADATALSPKEEQALLAEITEIGFTLDSFDKSSNSPINFAIIQKSIQVAERANLRTSSNASAVMALTLKSEKAGGMVNLVMQGDLKCRMPDGKMVSVWRHGSVLASVAERALNQPSGRRVFRDGLTDFFNQFVQDHQKARGAAAGAAEKPKPGTSP